MSFKDDRIEQMLNHKREREEKNKKQKQKQKHYIDYSYPSSPLWGGLWGQRNMLCVRNMLKHNKKKKNQQQQTKKQQQTNKQTNKKQNTTITTPALSSPLWGHMISLYVRNTQEVDEF